jgi:hypothetical protein
LHLSIFTHLCEAFIGVLPHFHLFQHFFFLEPIPDASRPAVVSGCELVLHPESQGEYLSYQPSGKGVEWKSFLFYVGNFESPLPERTPGAPKAQANWMCARPGGSQVTALLEVLARLKKNEATRDHVVYPFLSRRVQALQHRTHPAFRYEGTKDPSRFDKKMLQSTRQLQQVSDSSVIILGG